MFNFGFLQKNYGKLGYFSIGFGLQKPERGLICVVLPNDIFHTSKAKVDRKIVKNLENLG